MVEIDNIVNEETEVESNPVSNDGVEPEVKQTIEKKKKPRSPAQIAAFEKAIAKRKSNLEAKKKKVNIQEKKSPVIEEEKEMVKTSTNENTFPSTQTGFNPLDVDLKAWMEQEEPEPEPQVEEDEDDDDDYEEEDDADDDESSEEEEIVYKKKPKKVKAKPIPIPKKKPIEKKKKPKVVYISDSGTDDDEPEAPAKDPLEGMDFRSRARLRGF